MTQTAEPATMQAPKLRIAVAIATSGRATIVSETLALIARQSRRPDAILVAAPTAEDFDEASALTLGARVIRSARGLTRQRNALLDAAADCDVICFLDDDFVMRDDYLRALEAAFQDDPGLVGATGIVIADGITGPGYSFQDARGFLDAEATVRAGTERVYNGYGCNMAFRLAPIQGFSLRFDERLPRYGWLEDVDFSRRVAAFGRLARVLGAVGVHLGVKHGRQSGVCFGYSQIANPIHLVRKGSFAWVRAAWLMGRNIFMNLLFGLRPEPYVDRRGRVIGNARALQDIVMGRLRPERIEQLS